MGNLNFVLIGCGAIAEKHAAIISSIGSLIAVCDIDKKKADGFAKRYNAKKYFSSQKLFQKEKEIDVAVICTPNALHPEHVIQALKSGCHVLCEKPMAISTAKAKRMIKTAIKYKRKLFVVKQNRFNPPVAYIKELLNKNKLGKIYSFQLNCFWNRANDYYKKSNWKGIKKLDGGVLYTQFSHFIDLVYWYFGDLKPVYARIKNIAHKKVSALEDEGVIIFQTTSGILGGFNYTLNAYQKNMEGSLTIFAEKGTLKIGGQYLNTLEYFEVKDEVMPVLPKGNPANDYGGYKGSMGNHELVYKNLLEVITGKSKNYISGEDGIKSVEIIEKIYHAGK
ncbi:MAG TPA: Gfo/Idh/MocA family oxidoreductase [Chitinophagaceae bacterium]|nr:Gfo/Idh/MocA family oxidoreductase [Chitinophagaceae bacterium]